ncbi:ParB N-terminal domain-containing protein [Candidatus Poribacteria bacterium]|nr:ParB N-terminal domain-containing protein [Candidatus Poribacteria bacterium]
MLQIREVELSQLKPWEGNPRLNDQAVDAVVRSIGAFGFNVPILCDQNLTIIAGHTRWKAAKKLGMNAVPVIVFEMTDAQRRAFCIADNKAAEIADWDFPKLRDILAELSSEDIDLTNLGFNDEELRRILKDAEKDEDELPEAESEPQTRVGDLVILGSHRLACGDSRDKKMTEALTDGRKVDHVFAGPPYFNQREYAHWDEYQDYLLDMRKIVENCRDVLEDGGMLVWNIANESSSNYDHTSHHSLLLEESGLHYLDTIIWAKRGANYAIPRNCHIQRNRCYFPAFQWEALLVFQRPGNMPKMTREGAEYMSNYHTNVWDIAAVINQLKTFGHPAVCPVEIPYRCLQAYTGSNASVFEPFGGSGTTLIAAEKASRRAFIMERNPVYCDLIVKRWENLTGERAERRGSLSQRS